MPEYAAAPCTRAELQLVEPGLYVLTDEHPDPTPREVYDPNYNVVRTVSFTRRLARVMDKTPDPDPCAAWGAHLEHWVRASDGKTVVEIDDADELRNPPK